MRWLATLLLLMLGGCWVGSDFYRGQRPRPALAAGNYLLHQQGEQEPRQVRIETLRNGLLRATNMSLPEGEREQFTFALFPLAGQSGKYVVRVTATDEPIPSNQILYAAMERTTDGAFRIAAPVCDEDMRALAQRYRARLDAVGANLGFQLCSFRSRADLERALQALPASAFSERLVPVRGSR